MSQETDPAATPATQEPAPDASAPSPYRNLWVPLVVVPALIVVVLVLVFLLFGGIAGSESTISEDLDTAVNGGKNERTQAVFELTQKMLENQQARMAGGAEPWETGPEIVPALQRAWERLDEEDHQIRYVVAALQMLEGDPLGAEHLREFLALEEGDDPGGTLRRSALISLAVAQDPAALEPALALAEDPDRGVRREAVMLLSVLEGPEVDAALVAALGDHEFEVRANAAIALAERGDGRAAPVLLTMLDPATVEAEREAHPERFRGAERARNVRVAAIGALGMLGRPEDLAALEQVVESDADPEVRRAASEALAAAAPPAER